MKRAISIIGWILLAVGSGVLFNVLGFNPIPDRTGSALSITDTASETEGSCADKPDAHGHGEISAAGQNKNADADTDADAGAHGEFCTEHRLLEDEDALCHPDAVSRLEPGQGLKIRLSSPDAGEKAGISVSRPNMVLLPVGAPLPGRTEFNRSRLARITPRAQGTVQRVFMTPGQRAAKGDLLAEIATPEVSALSASLLAALARQSQTEEAYQREKDLLGRGITSRQEYLAAEAEYRSARSAADQYRSQLMDMGLSSGDIDDFLRDGKSRSALPVRAPFAGLLSETNIAAGEFVGPGTHLFTIADPDPLWIAVFVPETRIYQARPGGLVEAEFDGLPGQVFTGRIFQSGAALDEKSRTLKVLAEIPNPDHALKAGMYGRVRFIDEKQKPVAAVPADAVQDIDGAPYLFVRMENDLFELRRIEKGGASGEMIPVLDGISPAEEVVSAQAFALKSELLKARLGASCADH